MQLTLATLEAALGDLIATGAQFDPATTFLVPFTAITDAGLATVLANLTLAPGTLATPVGVTAWGDPYGLAGGQEVVDGPPTVWAPASAADNCIIIGFAWVNSATPTVLKGYEYLGQPVILNYPNSSDTMVPRLCLDPNGQWSASVNWDG